MLNRAIPQTTATAILEVRGVAEPPFLAWFSVLRGGVSALSVFLFVDFGVSVFGTHVEVVSG